jgi:hypothetical protein
MGSTLLTTISLDSLPKDSEGDFKSDHMKAIGVEDKNYNLTGTEEDNWNALYKLIESKYKQRDIDVFYRYFGLKGYQKEKGKDIAKSIGISSSAVTGIVNSILSTLKKDSKAMDILLDLQSSYNESLMFDLMNLNKDMIVESILSDNTFILLEELTKWADKKVYVNTITGALENLSKSEEKIITQILKGDFDYLDSHLKSNKKLIIKFLGLVYPTDSFSRKTDVSLLEFMIELMDLYKKYFK